MVGTCSVLHYLDPGGLASGGLSFLDAELEPHDLARRHR